MNSQESKPVWTMLSEPGGPHWQTLKRDNIPLGLFELMPANPEVIVDVGCFCGAVGSWLKKQYPNARVVGVEPLEEAVAEAKKCLDYVLHGKLEDVDLSKADIVPGSVDVIVLADVLEHMYDPWHALVSLKPLLKPNGVILASIPNIRNLMVIEDLVLGDFKYAGFGIMDVTHIRFFTWKGVQRLFAETGFKIDKFIFNKDPRCQALLEGLLKTKPPISINSQAMQIKNQSPEQLTELVTLQFWLSASAN